MAARTIEEFYERLLRRIGERARDRVLPVIPSETLRNSLQLDVSANLVEPRAVLFLPHYWAIYLHDGRGPVAPVTKRWLVWFQNPADDPRTAGGRNYPVRAADARRLTPAEWEAGLEENRERRARGLEPYMIVTKHAGPVEFPKSYKFFEDGMEGFGDQVGDVALAELQAYLDGMLPRFGGGNARQRTATFRL